MRACIIHGCENEAKARKLCSKHYERQRRHEDVGVNFRDRMYRIYINDISFYIPSIRTPTESAAICELFCLGKHQGTLVPNYGEAWVWGENEFYSDL
jgi:hypothetical protein